MSKRKEGFVEGAVRRTVEAIRRGKFKPLISNPKVKIEAKAPWQPVSNSMHYLFTASDPYVLPEEPSKERRFAVFNPSRGSGWLFDLYRKTYPKVAALWDKEDHSADMVPYVFPDRPVFPTFPLRFDDSPMPLGFFDKYLPVVKSTREAEAILEVGGGVGLEVGPRKVCVVNDMRVSFVEPLKSVANGTPISLKYYADLLMPKSAVENIIQGIVMSDRSWLYGDWETCKACDDRRPTGERCAVCERRLEEQQADMEKDRQGYEDFKAGLMQAARNGLQAEFFDGFVGYIKSGDDVSTAVSCALYDWDM